MDFPRFNFQQKNLWTRSTTLWTGGTAGSMVDQQRRVARRCSRSMVSPMVAGEDDEDEAESVSDSMEHERRWGGGATEVESGSGSSSVREWTRTGENS
jgi:hypothetical protein